MPGKQNNDIPSFIITGVIPGPPTVRPSFQPPFCDRISPTNAYGAPLRVISDLDTGLIPSSMVPSSDSATHFHTTTQLRDNLDQNLSDLTTHVLLDCIMAEPNQRASNATH